MVYSVTDAHLDLRAPNSANSLLFTANEHHAPPIFHAQNNNSHYHRQSLSTVILRLAAWFISQKLLKTLVQPFSEFELHCYIRFLCATILLQLRSKIILIILLDCLNKTLICFIFSVPFDHTFPHKTFYWHCFRTQQGVYFVSICLQCTFIVHVSGGGSTLRD